VPGAFAGDGQAVQLARQADGEIADVDHFLHFAQAFAETILPTSSVTRRAKVGLGRRAVLRPARRTSSPRRGARDVAPLVKGGLRAGDDGGHFVGPGLMDLGDIGAVDGRANGQRAPGQIGGGQACGGKDFGVGLEMVHGVTPVTRARWSGSAMEIRKGVGGLQVRWKSALLDIPRQLARIRL
jgi:hypothetical protein